MKIQIHQMLHGYNQGHNLIQGSIVLPSSEDMDCMATLSDWSRNETSWMCLDSQPSDFISSVVTNS